MSTVFSAQKALDHIQFYIDPRSVESPSRDRANAVAHPVSEVFGSDVTLGSAQGDVVARKLLSRTNTAEALSMGCATSHSCAGVPSPTVAPPETECLRAPLARNNAGFMSSQKHLPSDLFSSLETNEQDPPVAGPGFTGAHQGPNCNEEADKASQAHTIESVPRREEFDDPTPTEGRESIELAATEDHDRSWPDGCDNFDHLSMSASSKSFPRPLLCYNFEDDVAASTRELNLNAVDHDKQIARNNLGGDTASPIQKASVGVHPWKYSQQLDHPFIGVPQASNISVVDDAGHDSDDENSGSDIVRPSRRSYLKFRRACPHSPPNASTEPSRTPLDSGNHRRLRQGLRRAARLASPPAATVVIPASEREDALQSFNTGTTHQSTTGYVSQDSNQARIKIILELPSIPSSINVGLATLTVVPSSSTFPRKSIRYTDEENRLLAKLKQQRRPKLSWRSIQAHFPGRTINALQVHYHMHFRESFAACGERNL